MKKIRLLRYLILIKRILRKIFKSKKVDVLSDKEKLIIELLFKDIDTKESILLFYRIELKFLKQLRSRDVIATKEIEVIDNFLKSKNK